MYCSAPDAEDSTLGNESANYQPDGKAPEIESNSQIGNWESRRGLRKSEVTDDSHFPSGSPSEIDVPGVDALNQSLLESGFNEMDVRATWAKMMEALEVGNNTKRG